MNDPKLTWASHLPSIDDLDHDPDAKGKIDPELARANLLRMRGEYQASIDQCLSILKHLPEDVDTHILLGDIYSEQGDLVQAEQWYDLALELDPKNAPIKQKLGVLQERAQHKEIVETAEQLGLPPEAPRIAMYGAAMVLAILLIGVIAFFVGQHHPVAKTLNMPISASGASDLGSTDSTVDDGAKDGSNLTASSLTQTGMPQDDRTLTTTLAQRLPLGSHIVAAMEDPRTKILTLTYSLRPEEDQRMIGAELARSALDLTADVITVVLRGVREDRIVFMADVPRTKVNQTATSAWQADNSSDPDAWVGYVLSFEWNAISPDQSPSASGSTASGAATSGALQSNSAAAPNSTAPISQPSPSGANSGSQGSGQTGGAPAAGGSSTSGQGSTQGGGQGSSAPSSGSQASSGGGL